MRPGLGRALCVGSSHVFGGTREMLARLAHDRGLAAGLKNVPQLVPDLEGHFDFAVNEQCYQYDECRPYRRFIRHDEPVFVIEYELSRKEFCPQARRAGFTAMRKRYNLRAWRRTTLSSGTRGWGTSRAPRRRRSTSREGPRRPCPRTRQDGACSRRGCDPFPPRAFRCAGAPGSPEWT